MAVIGALRVNLGLDSAKFQNGLKRSQSSMAKFAARVKVAAAVAVAAFAAAAVKMTKSGLSFIDNQAKMARSIDGTIDGLRALQLAGGDAGVSAGAVGAAMQKLGRRLDEAQVKGGPVADALDRIGLSAADLMKMDADERLATIADRVKALGFSAQQTAGLLGEFGIRNAEMSLLVAQGGDAIRNARSELVALGLSINEVDAAKIESANDAFSRIGVGIEAVSNRMAIAFAPALESISNAFVALVREGGGLRIVIDALGESIGRIVSYAAGFAAILAGQWVIGMAAAVGATAGLSGALVVLKGAILRTGFGILIVGAGELVYWLGRVVSAAGGVSEALQRVYTVGKATLLGVGNTAWGLMNIMSGVASSIVGSFVSAFAMIGSSFDKLINGMSGAWNMLANSFVGDSLGLGTLGASNIGGTIGGVADGLFAQAADSIAQGGKRIVDAGNSVSDALRAAAQPLTVVVDGLDNGATAADSFATSLDGLGGGSGGGGGGAVASIGAVTSAVTTLQSRMEATKTTMQSAFTGLVTGAKSLRDTITDLLSSFAQMLANRAFESLWSGGLGGGIGSLFGLPSFEGGGSTGMGARSGGLDGKGGYMAMVHPQETIIDNTKGQRAGGGQSSIQIMLDPSLIGQILQQSAGQAVQIVQGSAATQQRQFAGNMTSVGDRGVS
tara:strand:+ start:18269 stop:20284 length:2016 start_codon:yes stop_codon:yes gene_type:complete